MKQQRELPLQGKLEPVVGTPLNEHAAREITAQLNRNKIDALCADVFKHTGLKLTAEDPIVLAALFQSELINSAGETAALRLQESTAKAAAVLTEAAKAAYTQSASLDQGIAAALQQMADGAKKLGDQELINMQSRFARMASETLDQVRRAASAQSPRGLRWKIMALLGTGLAAGLIGGFTLGRGTAHDFSHEQIRLMNNGVLLDATWSALPHSARALFGVAPKHAPEARLSTTAQPGKSARERKP